jgi:hypothetical protein
MLKELTELRAWLEAGRGGSAFRRYDQISWFVRVHRDELMASKAMIPGVGSRPTLVSPAFDTVVERIFRR